MFRLAAMGYLVGMFRFLVWIIALIEPVKCGSRYPKGYLPSLLYKHTRRDSADSEDQSWIKAWAAVGDSYAAGIGAGSRLGGAGDYFCSRYNESYPNLINSDKRLGDPNGRKFTFWACSGAETPAVTSNQIAKLDENSQQVITVSTGGNDVGLVDILNHCIFQWNPSVFSTCSYYLNKAQNIIDSDDFSKNLDNLLSTAKRKLTSDGILYWTGYAQFFAADDKQCDSVTWSFFWSFLRREYLTLERRQSMNDLVVKVNQKIKDAVARAGDQAVFVDYDQFYRSTLGRFCEAGYSEPFGNREGLLFYEYYTDDTVDPGSQDNQKTPSVRSGGLLMNGTFEASINTMVLEFMQKNGSDYKVQLAEAPTSSVKFDTNPSPDQNDVGTQVSIIPDSYGRVFHPRRGGHTLISNMVLWQMQVQKAKRANRPLPKVEIDSDTCPKEATPPAVSPKCGAGSIAPKDSIVAMKQPGIEVAYKDFCKSSDGKHVHLPDNVIEDAPPPFDIRYGPDGTGSPEPNDQGIYLKMTLVDGHTQGCLNDDYEIKNDDCQAAFSSLNNGCDTNTRTEKHGGTYEFRCIKYTLSGTGTPKYTPGWCGLHIIQYQKPDPSKDPYKVDIVMKDAKQIVIGNTLGAEDAQNPVSVAVFGGQLRQPLVVTTGGVDDDPVKFSFGDTSWDSNDESHCKMGKYDHGKRQGDCGFTC